MSLDKRKRYPNASRWAVRVVALTLLASVPLPIIASTPQPLPSNPKIDALRSPLHRRSGSRPRVNFGAGDAWLAKYKAGSNTATQTLWTKQLGTPGADTPNGIALDSEGNSFIAGETSREFGGVFFGGVTDAWVAKSAPDGALVWVRQLGTRFTDGAYSVAADRGGNVFVAGYTLFGSLGGNNQGSYDAWLAKYGPDGTLLWTQQLGTAGSDRAFGVATDANGNVFMAGETEGALKGSNQGGLDAWVAKYNAADGTLLWVRQLGTSDNDLTYGMATDRNGNVVIAGKRSNGAWAAKYSAGGALRWVRQLGSASGQEAAYGVATDSLGNIALAGTTLGDLGRPNLGGSDAWVAKYSANGTLRWTRQLGSPNADWATAIAIDSKDNVFLTGPTAGALSSPNQGGSDAWFAKYSPSGTLRWTHQTGTADADGPTGIAVDGSGNAVATGFTYGNFSGD
ncbi:MAG TPA: SBBP repeat-containing protein [Stenomitos sp.]